MEQILGFKGWLAQNNIKQKEIAELLGISQTSAYNKINGRQEFTMSQVRTICAHYDISADIFLPKMLRYSNNEGK